MNISAYVLTFNSERYISQILSQLDKFADEIVIVDSGSSDQTLHIARCFDKVVVYPRTFDNFKNQRNFAASMCKYDTIFFVDSDEVPDDILVQAILDVKKQYAADLPEKTAYKVRRNWTVLGKPVRAIYPVESPDYVVRLFNRRVSSFGSHSNTVHETLEGYEEALLLGGGGITHNTFHNQEEISRKLNLYTSLTASDMVRKKKNINLIKLFLDPLAAFFKWYISKGAWHDGKVGLTAGVYAYRYTFEKYRKALALIKDKIV